MKIATVSLVAALSAVAFAVPALQAAPKLDVRDTPEGTIDCSYCAGMLDFCFKVRDNQKQLEIVCPLTCAEWSYAGSRGLQADLP